MSSLQDAFHSLRRGLQMLHLQAPCRAHGWLRCNRIRYRIPVHYFYGDGMTSDFPLRDARFKWTHSSKTNVAERFKQAGWNPPEAVATETEQESRIEGALRAMKVIQREEV